MFPELFHQLTTTSREQIKLKRVLKLLSCIKVKYLTIGWPISYADSQFLWEIRNLFVYIPWYLFAHDNFIWDENFSYINIGCLLSSDISPYNIFLVIYFHDTLLDDTMLDLSSFLLGDFCDDCERQREREKERERERGRKREGTRKRREERNFRVGFLRASALHRAERSGVVTLGEPEAQARVLRAGNPPVCGLRRADL